MNYTLAIESSTQTPSAALLCDETVLEAASWESTRGSSQRMFSALQGLLKSNAIDLDSITLWAVGLGPGGFTGLRIALAAIRALAQPSKTPIIGISSAEALACRIQQEHAIRSGRIRVLGDARRKRLWVGDFETQPEGLTQTGDFTLIPISDFAKTLTDEDTLISPDWDRLEDDLTEILPSATVCIKSNTEPTASDIAQLARRRVAHEIPSEPLEPIYMHPPVFIEPRFTEATKRSLK